MSDTGKPKSRDDERKFVEERNRREEEKMALLKHLYETDPVHREVMDNLSQKIIDEGKAKRAAGSPADRRPDRDLQAPRFSLPDHPQAQEISHKAGQNRSHHTLQSGNEGNARPVAEEDRQEEHGNTVSAEDRSQAVPDPDRTR